MIWVPLNGIDNADRHKTQLAQCPEQQYIVKLQLEAFQIHAPAL